MSMLQCSRANGNFGCGSHEQTGHKPLTTTSATPHPTDVSTYLRSDRSVCPSSVAFLREKTQNRWVCDIQGHRIDLKHCARNESSRETQKKNKERSGGEPLLGWGREKSLRTVQDPQKCIFPYGWDTCQQTSTASLPCFLVRYPVPGDPNPRATPFRLAHQLSSVLRL